MVRRHPASVGRFSGGTIVADPAIAVTFNTDQILLGLAAGVREFGHYDHAMRRAARKTADGLMTCLREDGFLAGRLNPDWTSAVKWCCLTGNVQIAICWSLLFRITGDERYRGAASQANSFVRRTMALGVGADVDGGIQCSFPINGAYGRYELLNWASKFFIDSNALEQQLHEQSG